MPPEYEGLEVLLGNLERTYADAVQAFYARGCRYLQMDDSFFTYLSDPRIRAQMQAEGRDPD